MRNITTVVIKRCDITEETKFSESNTDLIFNPSKRFHTNARCKTGRYVEISLRE
jgi:hypothetical protein